MRPIIEFCVNNMHKGTDQVMKKLEKNPEYDVIEYGCLGNCGQCYVQPFALVNGEIISANDADALYEAILQGINDENDPFADLDL